MRNVLTLVVRLPGMNHAERGRSSDHPRPSADKHMTSNRGDIVTICIKISKINQEAISCVYK